MRRLVLTCLVCPGLAWAEEWQPLTGDQIRSALTARVLLFPEGVAQDFRADGGTIRAGSWGQWRVEGDRYCEIWAANRPICAEVDQNGLDLRFREETGFTRIGRYGDL